MKRVLLLLLFSIAGVWVLGQEGGTVFMDNEPWDMVIKKARQENKLIFVDCYTVWCGPCNKLSKEVFPQREMGDFMNEKFVCVKYDIEKDEGAKFKEKYANEISAYPTLLVLDTEGDLIHRLVGYQPMKSLREAIQRGLDGINVYDMRESYSQHKNERTFIKNYLWALRNANMMEEYKKVARSYTSQFSMDSLLTMDFWEMINPIVVNDPYCKEYPFILEHLGNLQMLGVERYALEEELNFYMMITINKFYTTLLSGHLEDIQNVFKDRVVYLQSLLKLPVKGFSVRQIELAAIECMFDNDVDKLYERLHVFMDCDMLGENYFYREVFVYLLKNLRDKNKVEECIDYIQNRSNWQEFQVKELVALGHKCLEQLSKEEK